MVSYPPNVVEDLFSVERLYESVVEVYLLQKTAYV
jgi:hypothetical protein